MPTGKEEYISALHLGQKEKKKREAEGLDPRPRVLDEELPEALQAQAVDLPLQEIPAELIVGTKSRGRMNVFSASFYPLAEPDTEFAAKWAALCEAHLSQTGIREAIECYEYLGEFFVAEGNKRVSVLRYFGAVRIPARIRRILPADRSDPRAAAYAEFLEFHRATGLYDIQFRKPGEYARLLAALGKKPGDAWEETEKKRLVSVFGRFKEAFAALGGPKQALRPEEALLLFLKVHPWEEMSAMTSAELKKALAELWGDVKTSSGTEAVTVTAAPKSEEAKSPIEKLLSGTILSPAPKHLNIGFISQRDPETSSWTRGHAEGAAALAAALGDAVKVTNYYGADSPLQTAALLDQAAADGAELIFTTAPPLLTETLKAAVRYPKIRFFSCSADQPLSSVRSYYCRVYEGKFITGLIAGALAENGIVGYVGSYPILGVPAAVNAFALGARMTNPRARILLEWSCTEGDPEQALAEKGARVISNRDVATPGAAGLWQGSLGTYCLNEGGTRLPLASPVWMWGRLYENIVRAVLAGSTEKKDAAVNYWWGMNSGVIDVTFSEYVPEGTAALAANFAAQLRAGTYDIFSRRLTAQDGSLIADGAGKLTLPEILKMDRLADFVEGRIPSFEELLPRSRALVRELGIYRETIPPETEAGQ
ncbi:MAG: BMP family ABC transporter substrate-binding protein [Lachnospiraceae bacterium]|nr:BMP family ABC transporter substrate-binding protein [Lachnospiraceae bacterium]